MYYGLTNTRQIREICEAVCITLGNGSNNNASLFLREIIAQETHSGKLRDRHADRLGVGLVQVDRIAFDDILRRTRPNVWDKIQEAHGIENNLNYEMLAYSPLLSILFARLFLRLIPEEFPVDLEGRAAYWKKYYNTAAGAGTAEEFIENVRAYL